MSLTSFVARSRVRDIFNKHCPLKKEFKPQTSPNLKAAPITKNYSQVGIAFDYIFRFYLEKLNPDCSLDFGWTSTKALQLFDIMSENYKIINEIIDNAKLHKNAYIDSGILTDDFLYSVLKLSSLEPIIRAGRGLEYIGQVHSDDIKDLKQLISLIHQDEWMGKNRCWLNPSFNAGILVGGADADIILDDMLIEIKTVKNFCVSRAYLNQLIGYYILDQIRGIDESGLPSSIKRLGIYFSRYGYLWSIKVEDLISEDFTEKTIFWLSRILSKNWELLDIPKPKDPRVNRDLAISNTSVTT